MEKREITRNEDKWAALQKAADRGTGLASALAVCACRGAYRKNMDILWDALRSACGISPDRLSALEQYWCPEVSRAVKSLVGAEEGEKIYEVLKLRIQCPHSAGLYRRSYHTKNFGKYAYLITDLLTQLISDACFSQSVEELLYCNTDNRYSYKYRLALEISQGNTQVISLIREAILGDNSTVLLSRSMIEAVIISGHEELLADLLKLLTAAKLQEGIRQQILESADSGSTEVLTRILKTCLDGDLFRYSGAIRALDTWTGLGYGDNKPANVKLCAQYAYACLTREKTRLEYFKSENTQKAYFGLWAMGCYELQDTEERVEWLLSSPDRHRQILGWLFVSRSDDASYQYYRAEKHIEKRDPELLAWITTCLPDLSRKINSYRLHGEPYALQTVRYNIFPNYSEDRKALFARFKETALFIGNKTPTFTGNPFDFSAVKLDNTLVMGCMMGIAAYDMNVDLVKELIDLQNLMNAEQRRTLIVRFLQPEKEPTHRICLRNAISDKSQYVREAAVERLAACRLYEGDYQVLAEGLRSKSSPIRKEILTVLQKQKTEDVKDILHTMLSDWEEFLNQAAVEILLNRREEPQLIEGFGQEIEALGKRELSTQTRILLDQLLAKPETAEAYTRENGYGLYSPEAVSAFTESIALPMEQKSPGLIGRLLGKKEKTNDLLSAKEIRAMLPTWEEADALLGQMDQEFQRHADYEYAALTWEGKEKVLFGDAKWNVLLPAEYGLGNLGVKNSKFEMLPFWEEFLQAMGSYATDPERYIALRYCMGDRVFAGRISSDSEIASWFMPYERMELVRSFREKGQKKYEKRYSQIAEILRKAQQKLDSHKLFEAGMRLYRSLLAILKAENLGRFYTQEKPNSRPSYYGGEKKTYVVNYWALLSARSILHNLELPQEDFLAWFSLEYGVEQKAGVPVIQSLDMEDYFRACESGTVPKDILMEYFLRSWTDAANDIGFLTGPTRWSRSRKLHESFPWAKDIAKTLVNRILQIEEKRGELPTDLTDHARAIERCEGAEHFCNLLAALGKEGFFRGYGFSGSTTKKAVFKSAFEAVPSGRRGHAGKIGGASG